MNPHAATWMAALALVVAFSTEAASQCPQPSWVSMNRFPALLNGPGPGCASEWDPDGPGPMELVLVVGGSIALSGLGAATHGLMVWEGDTSHDFAGGTNGGVGAMIHYNGELIVGGNFQTIGEASIPYIARWNGSSWQPLGAGVDGTVDCMTIYNGDLIVAGGFNTAGGAPADNIARWNGSVWQPIGGGVSGQEVYCVAVHDGDLYVGGHFNYAGPNGSLVLVNGLARWDGAA